MKDYKFLFSVIIPVYKVEKYLPETLQSVEAQTIGFDKIQVILVNDGTPDKSGEICENFKRKYPENVVYIEKENGGVSSARNAGMPFAQGKYVNFLDSDDKWDENAFLNAYNFFEEHYDEFDVLSCRVKRFEASDVWHALDYKYSDGNRIAVLDDPKDYNIMQFYVGSVFIKSEALKSDDLFDTKVKISEDAMFINKLILRKLKLGICADSIYYYRKRYDETSVTQSKHQSMDYYTTSPERCYKSFVDESVALYGEVIPYIQNVLAYDIGWRVREAPSEIILSDEKLYENYCSFLKTYLMYVDEKYIISNRVHRRIGFKVAMLRLRNGTDLLSETYFDKEKGAIFYKDMSLLRLRSKHKLCHINVCKVKENPENGKTELIIEGLIAKWVLDCCKDENVSFTVRVGKKNLEIKRRDYSLVKAKSFYGESNRYDSFRKKIDIGALLAEREKIKLEFCLNFSGEPYPITVNYGAFVPSAVEFSACNSIFSPYIITCKSGNITVRKSANIEEDIKLFREEEIKALTLLDKGEYVSRRNEIIAFREKLDSKKLWIIADKENEAGDNGEAFFRFMTDKVQNENSDIIPVFALSKESKDYERLSSCGKVISPEDDNFRLMLICSDKVIMSSPEKFLIDYLSDEEKIYVGDLVKNQVVIIDSKLIAKDKSETHGKFSTNVSLYCVAREKQVKSVLKADGCYFKEEVVLTGAPKFDFYSDEKEKLIVLKPHRIDDETAESFKESKTFNFWNALINSKKLQFAMLRYGYKGVLCLPEEYKEFKESFNENRYFRISEDTSKGALLVTDFYPGFEYAYNEKPIVYAHFINTEDFYELNPQRRGMFNFKNSGFGKVCHSGEVTDEIISLMKQKAVMPEEYKNRTDEFFSFKDRNNCQRVFDEIMKL